MTPQKQRTSLEGSPVSSIGRPYSKLEDDLGYGTGEPRCRGGGGMNNRRNQSASHGERDSEVEVKKKEIRRIGAWEGMSDHKYSTDQCLWYTAGFVCSFYQLVFFQKTVIRALPNVRLSKIEQSVRCPSRSLELDSQK